MLELLGIQLLQGPEREAWQRTAQEAANAIAGTGNQWLGPDPAERFVGFWGGLRGSPKTRKCFNTQMVKHWMIWGWYPPKPPDVPDPKRKATAKLG